MITQPRGMCLLPLLALLLTTPCFAALGPDKALTFGFLPSRSPVTLIKHYTPLREYLSGRLKRTIHLETATNYSSFLQYVRQRRYDFVLTAPHFALLAIDSGKYTAPLTYTKSLMADILIPRDSPLRQLKQLEGKRISLPPEKAIISMAAKHFLAQQGLTGPKAPRYVISKSHNASVYAMLAGDTDAAVASINVTRKFLRKGARIKKLATTGALPGMALLVARDLPKQLKANFTKSLILMDKTPAGRAALKKMGYAGYRLARPNEFEAARPYLKISNGQ